MPMAESGAEYLVVAMLCCNRRRAKGVHFTVGEELKLERR